MGSPLKNTGFTLIELMIVVGIIAGLATIAIPTYRQYVMASRMSECGNEVAAIRLGLEEFFLTNNTYTAAGGTLDGPGGVATLDANLGAFYRPSNTALGATSNCTYTVVITGGGTGYTITANGINDLTEMPTVATMTGP